MKFILHNYRRCPYCIRVRIVLELKKIPYDIVEEPLRVWTDWMIENVEDKRVPQLRILHNDGKETVMPESNDINMYLDSHYGELEYTPKESYEKMTSWFSWCEDVLKPQIDTYKYGRNLEFDKKRNIKDTKDLHELLEKLEESLTGNTYLLEERLTLADIAIIPFVRQIMRTRNGIFDFSKLPNVVTWTNSIIETKWFLKDVMKKVPLAVIERDLEKENQ